jgi:polar amino acid transport system substrate-binding protein
MDAVGALRSGQIDVVVTAFPAADMIAKKNPDLLRLPEHLDDEPVAVAIKKGNQKLLDDVNRVIGQLKADGTLASMKKRWFKPDLSPYEEPDIPPSTTGEVLKIGVTATREPFSFVDKTGRITGHDGELARLIGAHLKRPVVFSDMSYMALIPALQAGKIDLVVTGMFATEERRKSVDFSLSYFSSAQVMLVRKTKGLAQPTPLAAGTQPPPESSPWRSLTDSFYSNIILEDRYLLLWDGLKTTVIISILSTVLGTLLGAVVCFMRMSRPWLVNLIARIYISILRGTPVLVLLMMIFYVIFASVDVSPIMVAVIAFAMNFAAYSAEIFRTGILGVDKGQFEAGISMGLSKLETFIYIVLPQTVQRILPVFKGEFISLIKMTSVVGYIAVQDLTKASDIIRSRTFDAFFPLLMVAILYFLISWILMQALEYLERRTDPKYSRMRKEKA